MALAGCTSQKDQFKELATKLAEKERYMLLVNEADSALQHSEALREGYLTTMSQKSEIKVKNIELVGENAATAEVYIELPSLIVRKKLLGIGSRVDTTRTRRFNFSEAMILVKKEMGFKPEELKEQILKTYHFKKTSSGWTILKDSN